MKPATILAILSTTIVTLVSAGGVHSIPEGSPDGVYSHFIDEDGNPKATFLGPHGASVGSAQVKRSDSSVPSVKSAKFGKRDGPMCDNNNPNPVFINIKDKDQAIDSVFSQSINGYTFYGTRSWVWGSVAAFACDYGHGQNFNGSEFRAWQTSVDTQCGFGAGGYYDLPGSKSSYGRTVVGFGFC